MAYRSTKTKSLPQLILSLQSELRVQKQTLDDRSRKLHANIDKLERKLETKITARLKRQGRSGEYVKRHRPMWAEVPELTKQQIQMLSELEQEALFRTLDRLARLRSVDDAMADLRRLREALHRSLRDEEVISRILADGRRSSLPTSVALGAMTGSLLMGTLGMMVGNPSLQLVGIALGSVFGLVVPLMVELPSQRSVHQATGS